MLGVQHDQVKPGVDYALTELVHCCSQNEMGVQEAVMECAKRYLEPVLATSGARVLLVLGEHAKRSLVDLLRLPAGRTVVPREVGGRSRYLVFIPHANARVKRTLTTCLSADDLARVRAHVGKAENR